MTPDLAENRTVSVLFMFIVSVHRTGTDTEKHSIIKFLLPAAVTCTSSLKIPRKTARYGTSSVLSRQCEVILLPWVLVLFSRIWCAQRESLYYIPKSQCFLYLCLIIFDYLLPGNLTSACHLVYHLLLSYILLPNPCLSSLLRMGSSPKS
jgi:hypothetical protein